MPPLSSLFVLLGLLSLSAFFSASEAALISLNKVRLRHAVEKKRRGAARVYRLVSRMDRLIGTILVGNNLVNAGIAALSTLVLGELFGDQGTGALVATFASTAVLVVFGDFLPKVMATTHPERTSFVFRHLIDIFMFVFAPITNLLSKVSNLFIRLFGGNPQARSPILTEEEMKMMITIGKEEGFYGEGERKMLERIFHFDDTEVRDVMTPLEDMTSVPLGIDEEELERVLLEEGHNRIPVFEGAKDNIVGILYVRDLLYLFKQSTLIHMKDLMSAPYFVPPTMKTADLLREFQRRKLQIAIVRDAAGKAMGLVTLEDLIEEIVGEIDEIDSKLMK